MSLSIGDKIGPYEILGPLGAGGMGEVYKAHDTKLDRDVAIKVLPAALARDPERLARFEREARVLASLNHPNIAQIYGIEESETGQSLVMELVPGRTLATCGALPWEEALTIARQIAGALQTAHDRNIVHRDLKPANIMLTPDGAVKVLDFGLAKLSERASSASGASAEHSPTLTMHATEVGLILGTAAYMSPEQARGQEVDRRADVWAFGVVLYEMLTGKRLFEGETISDVLATVLKVEPDLSAAPAQARPLLERCLRKDPKKRLQAIGDFELLLETRTALDPGDQSPAASSMPARYTQLAFVAVGVLLAALAALAFVHFRETAPPTRVVRFQIPGPANTGTEMMRLSPDGKYLAFIAPGSSANQLWVRAMDSLQAHVVAGTEGATYPFWSPDNETIAFFADRKLKKIAVSGGTAQTLCDVTDGRGGTWNRDGVILFSAGPTQPIFRVPSAGGAATVVSKLPSGQGGNRFPEFLPDGRHFLYVAQSENPESTGLFVGSLDGATPVRITPEGTNGVYAPPASPGGSGHLLFRREETLMAQPFDPQFLKTTGEIFPVAEQVPFSQNTGFGSFSVSETGTLVYRTGGGGSNRELAWVDRSGKRLSTVTKPGAFRGTRLSPDGKSLLAEVGSASQHDLWMVDLGRDVMSRFTFHSVLTDYPVWSPDSSRVVFSKTDTGKYLNVFYQKPANGSGAEQQLLEAGVNASPNDWSADGKWIVYAVMGQNTGLDLWLLPMSSEGKPVVYLQTPFVEQNARFSPDGKWMAYDSNESGHSEVYVQAIPANGGKFQISTGAGINPAWRADGKEIYFSTGGTGGGMLMAAPVKTGSTFEPGTPQGLFPLKGLEDDQSVYAASRDGQKFLVNVPAGGEGAIAASPVTVVLNWLAGVKK